MCWLPLPFVPSPGTMAAGSPLIWKITKKKVEIVGRPSDLEIDPGGKAGWLNLYTLDKNGKRTQFMWRAIYQVADDYLLICAGTGTDPVRPTRFSTSPQDKKLRYVYMFRRSSVQLTVHGVLKKF
jgi:hypothetical protein